MNSDHLSEKEEAILPPMQYKLLKMLEWFDNYCTENGICYYVAGGTLLGAIRHKGFIPWDDDIDLILPRPDYEKLLLLFTEQKDDYVLETPYSGNSDYLYSFAKLYDTTTTLVERLKTKCRRGVYIDLFPLDGLGHTQSKAMKVFSKVDRLNMFLMTRTCAIREGRSFLKNMAIVLMRMIPQFIVNNKELSIKVDKAAAQESYEDSMYVANLMGAYREKEIIEKRLLGKPTRYAFESIYVNGAENYEEYLTHIYGDWRKLPPKEKQVSHHDFCELDLERSYLLPDKA